MKKDFFKNNTDDEIRLIRKQLIESYLTINDKLPEDIKTFLEGKNVQIGNQHTRVNRCINLLEQECIFRFLNPESWTARNLKKT